MTDEERTTKYLEACAMLVDLAAEEVNIHGRALELKLARVYARDETFNEIVEKIKDDYQHA